MIEWISIKDKLPENNQRVLIWNGGVDVATFKRGISQEERELMKQGKLKDWEEEGWCLSAGYTMHKRSGIVKGYDECGNNSVPYGWDVGITILFGQNVDYWADINQPKQLQEFEDKIENKRLKEEKTCKNISEMHPLTDLLVASAE